MEPHDHFDSLKKPEQQPRRRGVLKPILNTAAVVVLLVGGYFAYPFIARAISPLPGSRESSRSTRVLQLDVLNGCGAKHAGARMMNFLRASGFDVVEMKNYKTFNVPHTLVVDRVGDLGAARRVADVLGVTNKNVIQQINSDYFVDVSVIIGEDYSSLRLPE